LSGPIIHPITSDSDQVYVVSSGDLFCFGADGKPLWKTSINADGPAVPMSGGIYVPNGLGAMQVLARDTGEILKSYGGKEPVRTGPLFLRGQAVWVDQAGNIVTETGVTNFATDDAVGGAASDGTVAIIGSASNTVYAFDASRVIWTSSLPGAALHHPTIFGGRVYVPYTTHDGEPGGVKALSLDDGSTIWETRVNYAPGRAAAMGRHLVIPDQQAGIIAIDVAHGGIRWRAPSPAVFSIQPAVVSEAIYVGDSDGLLRRLDMADGGTVWSIDLGAAITASPTLHSNRIIVGSADGRVIAIRGTP
jgi:outer membrane protein assembly factor BamB